VLFGDYNPAGRLPVTFYKSVEQLPPFDDYKMDGRTYRYFQGEPLYAFGYGLSYTRFEYSNLRMNKTVDAGRNLEIGVDVRNTGKVDGDEVVQLYISDPSANVAVPIRSLAGVERIHLKSGEKRTVKFLLTPRQMSIVRNDGKRVLEPGELNIAIGGGQPGPQTVSGAVVKGSFTVRGTAIEIHER
jgi:beta-glucosidase